MGGGGEGVRQSTGYQRNGSLLDLVSYTVIFLTISCNGEVYKGRPTPKSAQNSLPEGKAG